MYNSRYSATISISFTFYPTLTKDFTFRVVTTCKITSINALNVPTTVQYYYDAGLGPVETSLSTVVYNQVPACLSEFHSKFVFTVSPDSGGFITTDEVGPKITVGATVINAFTEFTVTV